MPDNFVPIEGPYSEHIGGAWTHPKTGAVYFLTTWRKDSRGPYWLQCWEDVPPYGNPAIVWQASADPWGHGTQTWLPDGSLYVAVPGNVDGTGKVKPSIHIEPGVTPPIPIGGGGGTAAAPVPIPPGGALASLYTGIYGPADFDTPQETALRVQKLLDAEQEMTELLILAGVLTR